jgi:hypothetical protein
MGCQLGYHPPFLVGLAIRMPVCVYVGSVRRMESAASLNINARPAGIRQPKSAPNFTFTRKPSSAMGKKVFSTPKASMTKAASFSRRSMDNCPNLSTENVYVIGAVTQNLLRMCAERWRMKPEPFWCTW